MMWENIYLDKSALYSSQLNAIHDVPVMFKLHVQLFVFTL